MEQEESTCLTSGSTKKPQSSRRYGMVLAAAIAKSLQSCLTLCDPKASSLPGFHVPGILQARTLEWVVISFSNAWNWQVKVKSLSSVWFLATPWTAPYQAPLSTGFSRQEYWSGLQLPSPIYYTHILFVRLFYQSPNEVLKVSWCDFVSMCFSFPLSSLLLFFLSIFGFVYCDLCVFAVYLLRIFMLSWSIKSYVTMSNLFSGISFRLEVQFV